jgi:hypothetical protein
LGYIIRYHTKLSYNEPFSIILYNILVCWARPGRKKHAGKPYFSKNFAEIRNFSSIFGNSQKFANLRRSVWSSSVLWVLRKIRKCDVFLKKTCHDAEKRGHFSKKSRKSTIFQQFSDIFGISPICADASGVLLRFEFCEKSENATFSQKNAVTTPKTRTHVFRFDHRWLFSGAQLGAPRVKLACGSIGMV